MIYSTSKFWILWIRDLVMPIIDAKKNITHVPKMKKMITEEIIRKALEIERSGKAKA